MKKALVWMLVAQMFLLGVPSSGRAENLCDATRESFYTDGSGDTRVVEDWYNQNFLTVQNIENLETEMATVEAPSDTVEAATETETADLDAETADAEATQPQAAELVEPMEPEEAAPTITSTVSLGLPRLAAKGDVFGIDHITIGQTNVTGFQLVTFSNDTKGIDAVTAEGTFIVPLDSTPLITVYEREPVFGGGYATIPKNITRIILNANEIKFQTGEEGSYSTVFTLTIPQQ